MTTKDRKGSRHRCKFCGTWTFSVWAVCAVHRPLLLEDYRYVRTDAVVESLRR